MGNTNQLNQHGNAQENRASKDPRTVPAASGDATVNRPHDATAKRTQGGDPDEYNRSVNGPNITDNTPGPHDDLRSQLENSF